MRKVVVRDLTIPNFEWTSGTFGSLEDKKGWFLSLMQRGLKSRLENLWLITMNPVGLIAKATQ